MRLCRAATTWGFRLWHCWPGRPWRGAGHVRSDLHGELQAPCPEIAGISNTVLPSTAEWTSTVLQRLDTLFLRKPVERAVFHFACRTILRSPRHRLYLGAYAGVGLALTLVGIASTVLRSADVGIEPYDPSLLSIPLVMSFFILCGLRFIFTIPAELNANWIFRLVQDAPPQEDLSGVRKVMWTFGVVPLPLSLFPFYAALWGGRGVVAASDLCTHSGWNSGGDSVAQVSEGSFYLLLSSRKSQPETLLVSLRRFLLGLRLWNGVDRAYDAGASDSFRHFLRCCFCCSVLPEH